MRHTNRLIHATSPYLLQHAHNPVDWYPWGEEALEKARREDKPIFLSIGYAACHWCHVMERESFEDEEIARVMNERFVNIKVDREERPDLDDLYMMAVQQMTGSGGWPMSVWLTPDLRPFYAGTYFPPNDRWGRPGFKSLLLQLDQAWRERRADVEAVASRAAEAIRQYASLQTQARPLDPDLIPRAIDAITARFDETHGGFGSAPKFPPAMALALILWELKRLDERPASPGARPTTGSLPVTGEPSGPASAARAARLRRVVTLTLDHMAMGGIYDQIGGGFHRYSTDAYWLVPHFEKMLYDNALLVPVYAEAHRHFGDPFYARVARETLDFVLRELTHPEGGFYSTLDADSEGEEGKFYVWTPQQVEAVLGREDADLFCRVYDITPGGNWEGKSIPHLVKPVAVWAEELNEAPGALQARLDAMRARLLEARSKRVRPGLDDKILASWNGLMIRAMALAAAALGEPRYREAASSAANFLFTHLQRDGRLLRSWRNGRAVPVAFHDDYAFFIVALLDLYETTGEARWLSEARRLTAVMNDLFWDDAEGGYFTTPHDHEPLIARLKSPEDGAIPSGNAMAALALLRLGRIENDTNLLARAERLLTTHAVVMERAPAAFPQLLIAAAEYLEASGARGQAPGDEGRVVKPEARVRTELVPPAVTAAPGGEFTVTARLSIPEGWHVNAHAPRQAYLIPTVVQLATPPGFAFRHARYPEPMLLRVEGAGEELAVYEGTTEIQIVAAADPDLTTGDYFLRVALTYQPCTDRDCLAPVEEWLTLPVRVG